MPLFQQSVLKKYLSAQDKAAMAAAYARFSAYFLNKEIQQNIRNSKEEQFQQKFLMELFVNVFGYVMNPDAGFNLTTELKNIKDAKKTDGAILTADGAALAVIELKGTDTKDLDKVNDQAFNYKNNQPDCVYVITSNFEKLRFYIHNAVEHEEFNLFTLTEERFALLWLFLQKDNLLSGIPAKVKEESLLAEEKITKALYADYSAFKQALWEDMVQRNPQHDQLLLYKKSQKLLDRFLFILFAEDKGLLPPNSISEIVTHWRRLKDMDEYRPMYDIFNKYFGYMNVGRKQPNKAEIHAYNGGLFAEDDVLDVIFISDEVLETHCLKLSTYNFESEVDTNILGHIFEHSLNDIENVRAQLEGTELDKSKTKRKKDGVFYTPKYITKYIVDNTVGKLCEEKKAEIGIDEAEFAKDRKGRKTDTLKKLDAQLKQYRDWLLQLTICDPACGSGAFLNQALEFLMGEHRYVDELEAQLLGYAFEFPGVEAHILEHNIYGVDINEESVEIARLSLWLRTAKKGRKLTSLSSNIKCGNSLIDDPAVAGDLAFNWQKEFVKVFEKGGFDVVIGNPPYVQLSKIESTSEEERGYLVTRYGTSGGRLNTYIFFIHLISKISKQNGLSGYIIPNTVLTQEYYDDTRSLLLKSQNIYEIVTYPYMPFSDAVVENISLFMRTTDSISSIPILEQTISSMKHIKTISKASIALAHKHSIEIKGDSVTEKLDTSKFTSLEEFVEINQAIALKGDKSLSVKADYQEGYYKLIDGKHINKYSISWGGDFLEYDLDRIHSCKRQDIFESVEKLFFRRVSSTLIFTYDDEQYYALNTLIVVNLKAGVTTSLKSLLGILNSKLLNHYYDKKYKSTKTVFSEIQTRTVKLLPIPEISDNVNLTLTELVERRLQTTKGNENHVNSFLSLLQSQFDLPKQSTKLQQWPSLDFKGFIAELGKAKVVLSLDKQEEWMAYFTKKKTEANALQREIDRIDKEIDKMVYGLYGLSEEEIRIVEGNN